MRVNKIKAVVPSAAFGIFDYIQSFSCRSIMLFLSNFMLKKSFYPFAGICLNLLLLSFGVFIIIVVSSLSSYAQNWPSRYPEEGGAGIGDCTRSDTPCIRTLNCSVSGRGCSEVNCPGEIVSCGGGGDRGCHPTDGQACTECPYGTTYCGEGPTGTRLKCVQNLTTTTNYSYQPPIPGAEFRPPFPTPYYSWSDVCADNWLYDCSATPCPCCPGQTTGCTCDPLPGGGIPGARIVAINPQILYCMLNVCDLSMNLQMHTEIVICGFTVVACPGDCSGDPCCGSTDPCCGHENDPCCGSTDPVCSL
ncbi:MAG TPA: hypothetical protein PKA63_14505, partial [Oligoflexia bacterium]|nr:hypothetical protein [Oligoflexia bacterium]HMP49877.1 hypothetical protein [Oligoflexia bacterium]